MTALIVILCILALFLLLLLSKIRLFVKYDADGITVKAGIWFLRKNIIGGESKQINKKDFRIKRFRARSKKVLKKYNKKQLKKTDKKTKGYETKENTENDEGNSSKKKKSALIPSSPKELVDMVRTVFGKFFKKFPGYLYIKCSRLVIGVGGKDAHDIAVKYGETVQAVQYLITFLGEISNLKEARSSVISVYPDFASGKWEAQIDIEASIRLINILRLGVQVLKGFFKHRKNRQVKLSEKKA